MGAVSDREEIHRVVVSCPARMNENEISAAAAHHATRLAPAIVRDLVKRFMKHAPQRFLPPVLARNMVFLMRDSEAATRNIAILLGQGLSAAIQDVKQLAIETNDVRDMVIDYADVFHGVARHIKYCDLQPVQSMPGRRRSALGTPLLQ